MTTEPEEWRSPGDVDEAAAQAAELVRGTRIAAGLTQAQLAHRADTTQAMIARYERGAISPTVRTLARIIAACDRQLVLGVAAQSRRSPRHTEAGRGTSDYLNRPDSGWRPAG